MLLVNGKFQPTLEFTQGDEVEVTVRNSIPADWPTTANGISIHWHGFSLKDQPWMDGTKYVSQCPIPGGSSFTYRFRVNEMPGTYFWHDHSSMNRADGLQGGLIVHRRRDDGSRAIIGSDDSQLLLLSDWWHFTGNAMAMRLNRPFDPNQASDASGGWCWVGLPKSILLNGKGNYGDCEDVYKRKVNESLPLRPADKPATAAAKDLLAPNACVAGQLGPTAEPSSCAIPSNPGKCQASRTEVTVRPGSTTRLRLINAGMLVYMTVCVEKHTLTVVALDAAPVEPRSFYECVDVNTGQRADVLIKADQAAGAYWISVGSQYRKGAPAGYGVLKYKGSGGKPNPANIIQPGPFVDRKWSIPQTMGFKPHPALLNPNKDAATKALAKPYLAPAAPLASFQLPARQVDARFVLQSTQPIIEANGILRWALDNVAHAVAPPCTPLLDQVYDKAFPKPGELLAGNAAAAAAAAALYFTPTGGNASTWSVKGDKLAVVEGAPGKNGAVLLDLGKPGAATHTITLPRGALVEIVIENNRAGAFGGEYASKNDSLTNNRNGREQHSFHLHGHHFWQVGMGLGGWSADKVDGPEYNLASPILRDTTTVFFNGSTETKAAWVALRFVADNPGVWPLHCHIAWHEAMGQGLNIVEDVPGIIAADQPKMPACPAKCLASFAQFNPRAAQEAYGNSGLLAPDASNLP